MNLSELQIQKPVLLWWLVREKVTETLLKKNEY